MRTVLLLLACTLLSDGMARAAEGGSGAPRWEKANLQAVHEARLGLARERQTLPRLLVYEDFRAALHVPVGNSEPTEEAQVLAAAKKAGVRVVMLASKDGLNTSPGLREGVLFLNGSEGKDGLLRLPKSAEAGRELRFLSPAKEAAEVDQAELTGMEMVVQFPGAKGFEQFLAQAAEKPETWQAVSQHFQDYPDEMFAAGIEHRPELLAQWDRLLRKRPCTGIGANTVDRSLRFKGVTFDSYELSFRNLSTHILANELTEAEIRQALQEGHVYVAHDWLCDPTGFVFGAHNNLGTFPMGDRALMWEKTQVMAFTPVAAKLKLFHNGALVRETIGTNLTYTAKAPGAYRVEAWLTVAGEERPWIYSNPVYLEKMGLGSLPWPMMDTNAPVEVKKDFTYASGKPEDENKHKLDLYLPKEKKGAPVFIFLHGGAWRNGDRSLYEALGYRFAKEGVLMVIPSYRLGPKNKHPSQVEDAAAAFAWTLKNIAAHGGDTNRIFVGGHSAGGHMAALLALDPRYLAAHQLSPRNIKGVVTLSGVYDLNISESQSAVFGKDPDFRRKASPLYHISSAAPPFLVTYCQWDYVPLGVQAKQFSSALKKAGVPTQLHFTPRENHIWEVIAMTRDNDPTTGAVLRFIQ